jgi:Leucine-rich repeat (LRR) protein
MILNREALIERFKYNLNSLANLQLRESRIQQVDKDAFTGLTNLYSIDLGKNEIKHLDKDAFKGLKNLREIWLNNNQISSLDVDTFKGLENLKAIYLNDNKFPAERLELYLEENVQYVTFKKKWQNDFFRRIKNTNEVNTVD